MEEPIITVQNGETFGSVAWQDRIGKQIIMKLARGDKLTPGEEGCRIMGRIRGIKFWKDNVKPKWLRIVEDEEGNSNYGLLEGRYCSKCDDMRLPANETEVTEIHRINAYHPYYVALIVCIQGHVQEIIIEPCPCCGVIQEQESLYDEMSAFDEEDNLIGCVLCDGIYPQQ